MPKRIKSIMLFISLLIVFLAMFLIPTKEAYSASGSYSSIELTRTELQNMIVSTALSYYFKREYTDYEQRSIDSASTFQWRNYNVTPEQLGRSNVINIACSAFTGVSDIYSIGFDFSPYHTYSTISFQNYDVTNHLKRFYAKDSPLYLQTAYLNYGKGASASGISMMVNQMLNDYGVIPECTGSTCANFKYKSGDKYTKDGVNIGDFASDLIYYYEIKLNKANVTKEARAKLLEGTTSMSISATGVDYASQDQTAIKNEIINLLQPGDNLYYLRLDDKTIKGHAMLYIGDALGDTHGFLHSAGDDFDMGSEDSDGFVVPSNVVMGDDDYALWHDTWEAKIERAQISSYMFRTNSKKSYAIFIMRPTNRYCNSDDKCYIGYNNSNQAKNTITSEKYKENANIYFNNAITREKLKYLRTEQYQSFTRDGETAITEYLNEYNSVNVGDIVSYSLELTNMASKYKKTVVYSDANNPNNGQIIINAPVPNDTEYVSCDRGSAASCDYVNGAVIWSGINLSTDSTAQKYTYNVRTLKQGKVENSGIEIIYSYKCPNSLDTCANALQMGSMKLNVNNTVNNAKADQLQAAINSKISQSKKYNDAYEFIVDVYKDVYNVNLANEFTQQKIRDGIFKTMPEKWENEYLYAENNITAYNNSTSFVRRLIFNGQQDRINNMLVSGAYGGRKMKYNVEGNRAKILFKKNIKSTLEIGDILILWDYPNATSTKTLKVYPYIFYGYNSSRQPIFVLYNGSKYTKYGASDDAGYQILKKAYAYDLFAILRPSKIITTGISIDENWRSVSRIPLGTSITELSSNISATNGSTVNIKNHLGNNITDRNTVVTGDFAQFNDKEYFIIVTGDVDANGEMTKNDAIIITKYIVSGNSQYEYNYLLAGDLYDDDILQMNDVMMMLNEVNN